MGEYISPEVSRLINERVAELTGNGNREFVPFPVPIHPTDTPLVRHAGADYTCTGCGGPIPAGAWLHETVENDMVVGLRAVSGSDGPLLHQCGRAGT